VEIVYVPDRTTIFPTGDPPMKRRNLYGFKLMTALAAFILLTAACQGAPDPSPAVSPTNFPTPSPSAGAAPAATPTPAVSPLPSPSPEFSPGQGSKVTPLKKVSESETIMNKMRMVNEGLQDYSAALTLKMKAKYSVLELPLNLDGDYYFKQPDKHKIKVNRAPNFLAQYPQVFGWSLPDPAEYTSKVKGRENGCVILRLVPRMGMGDLLKIEIWVDETTYRYPKQIYYYRDAGRITLEITYRQVEGFYLFDRLQGTFEFPKNRLTASGQATYRDYRINKGIPDSLFEEDKKN
jgi:outer membrane lipoprotein-sorting protein